LQSQVSPPAEAVAPPPLARSEALEIVLVGPPAEADRLQALLAVTAGRHRTLTWSRREEAPLDEMLAPAPEDHPRIWVDLTSPAKIRLVLAVDDRGGTSLIRGVEDPVPRDPAAHLVAQETVAQIVEAYVAKAKPLDEPLAPVSTTPRSTASTQASSAEPPLAVAHAGASPPPAVTSATPPHDRWITAWIGTHTSPFLWGEPHTEDHFLGPSFAVAYRQAWRAFYWGVGASVELAERTIDQTDLTSQFGTLALQVGAFKKWKDFRFSLGIAAGPVLLRQNVTDGGGYLSPSDLGVTWTAGAAFVMGAGFEAPLGSLFLSLQVNMPTIFLTKVTIDYFGGTERRSDRYVQGLVGLGVHL